MLIIDTDYSKLTAANIEQIFYMVPMDGRNDNFDMVAMTPGGTVLRASSPTKPDGFDARFPNATEVEAFTLT